MKIHVEQIATGRRNKDSISRSFLFFPALRRPHYAKKKEEKKMKKNEKCITVRRAVLNRKLNET